VAKRAESDADGKSLLKRIAGLIQRTAKKYKVAPYDVTSTQFWSVVGEKVDEWQVRKLGGFTGIRDLEFPAPPERVESNAILPRMRQKTYKYKPPRLENFTVHDSAKLRDLFKLAKLKDTDTFNVLVQPDTHVPEHDEVAVNAFLKFADWYKPHGYVNLGDFMEMGSVSHWDPKDARPRRFVPEVKAAKELLGRIDKALGPQCIYKRFLIGNHEDWLEQYLITRMSEVYDGIEEVGVNLRVQDFLGLKDLGYRVIPLNEILRLGELHFIHGFYTNIHHAKKHLEVFGCNLMYGHLHDVQSYSGVSVKGVHESMSIGCLRLLNAPFMKGRPNNWSHAFAIIEYRIDGTYTRLVPLIVDGKFSFYGKVFDGRV
jgi:hypothetical protein